MHLSSVFKTSPHVGTNINPPNNSFFLEISLIISQNHNSTSTQGFLQSIPPSKVSHNQRYVRLLIDTLLCLYMCIPTNIFFNNLLSDCINVESWYAYVKLGYFEKKRQNLAQRRVMYMSLSSLTQ